MKQTSGLRSTGVVVAADVSRETAPSHAALCARGRLGFGGWDGSPRAYFRYCGIYGDATVALHAFRDGGNV